MCLIITKFFFQFSITKNLLYQNIKKDVDGSKLNGFGMNLNTPSCAVETKSQNDTIVKAIEVIQLKKKEFTLVLIHKKC